MMIRLLVEPLYVECLQCRPELKGIAIYDGEQQQLDISRQNNTILVVKGFTKTHDEQACYSTCNELSYSRWLFNLLRPLRDQIGSHQWLLYP